MLHSSIDHIVISWHLQFNPVYEFESDRTGIVLQMTDSYQVRNEILLQLQRNANNWFELALGRAPIELQSTLQVGQSNHWTLCFFLNLFQKYLAINQTMSNPSDSSELGATIAEKFGKAVGPVSRQLSKCFPFVTSLNALMTYPQLRSRV